MNLYLVRHGETEWNRGGRAQGRADIPLNEAGLQQAQALSRAFSSMSVADILSSPSQRALHTAEAIAAPHSCGVTTDDNLLELDFGALDGAPLRDMRALFPDFFEHWTRDPATAQFPDGGETLGTLQERTWSVVESVARAHDAQANVIIVSHAFALYSVMCRALGMPLSNYGRLRITPGTFSLLVSRAPNVIGSSAELQWALTSLNVSPAPADDTP